MLMEQRYLPVPMPIHAHRLFPADPQAARYHEERLDSIMDVCKSWPPYNAGIDSGFTYWGQFLAHDITINNEDVRSSYFDLDSLYGGYRVSDSAVIKSETGEFRLGSTSPHRGAPGSHLDLIRHNRQALIPDSRNDENLLVAQFHLLMQRSHNAILRTLLGGGHCDSPESSFELAKNVLTSIFLHLVENEYLWKISDKTVYRHICQEGNRHFRWGMDSELPLELRDAVMRFGHSQIRESYSLNSVNKETVSLGQIFQLRGRGDFEGCRSLPADRFVEWNRFFSVDSYIPQSGLPIDPMIVGGMQRIPKKDSIFFINLKAGIDAQLPSGQQVAAHLLDHLPGLEELGIHRDLEDMPEDNRCRKSEALARLRTAGVEDRTPLWLYVLTEASLSQAKGNFLGPLGSLLICEALMNAVDNARSAHSYEPLDACFELLGEPIDSIGKLIAFVQKNEKEHLNE